MDRSDPRGVALHRHRRPRHGEERVTSSGEARERSRGRKPADPGPENGDGEVSAVAHDPSYRVAAIACTEGSGSV